MTGQSIARIAAILILAVMTQAKAAQTYHKDTDWNFGLVSYHKQDVTWTSENGNRFIEFKLEGGRPGHGTGDGNRRHGAKYWERNEYTGERRMGKNNPYELTFEFRIIEGFNGKGETFFQVHSWDQHCQYKPQIMVKFDNSRLRIYSKIKNEQHRVTQVDANVDDFKRKWTQFKVVAMPVNEDLVQYEFSGPLFKNSVVVTAHLDDCSNQNLKFGIYRPGPESGRNETSIIQFDKIQLTKPR